VNAHYRFVKRIEGSPQRIFDLVSDMPNYGRWLPGSPAFGATTQVSPYPVRLGTTYLDAGPLGERPGTVTAFDPPNYIEFHQTHRLKLGPVSGSVDIHASYRIEQEAGTACVVRDLDLAIETQGLARFAQPLIARAFRIENERTLAQLKRYVETGKAAGRS
jgi:Polyketide cyclase / dehydrase and lipid transport